jgi:hypothetical protein
MYGIFILITSMIKLFLCFALQNDESAVYISCKYGHYDCVRRLIVVGSDYNARSKVINNMERSKSVQFYYQDIELQQFDWLIDWCLMPTQQFFSYIIS